MTFANVTFLSLNLIESESSVLQFGDDEFFFLLNSSLSTNASSLENKKLEQLPSAKDKLLQVYK